MLDRSAALTFGAALLLAAGSAAAAPYRVVSGAVLDPESGTEEPIAGSFEISPFAIDASVVPGALLIDDFLLEFAGESFAPRMPAEFEGFRALGLRIADHIQFDGDAVTLAFFQAGGEPIGANESQVGFRFLEFRAEGPGAGMLIGGDPAQPRRIVLSGSLAEVDQYYRIPPDECPVIPTQPIPLPTPPVDGGGVLIGEDGSTIEGGIVIANAPDLGLLATQVGMILVPTLEELGIRAPDGAVVSYDGSELTVSTAGDLFIDAGLWDLPGLVSIRLEAGGDITLQGTLELPSDTILRVDAGGSFGGALVIGGNLVPPDDIIVPAPPIFLCNLLPIFPAERKELGVLSLVLSSARLVDVDVRPYRVVPTSRGSVWVVIHGSPELDVRDVDAESLRFGAGQAQLVTRGRFGPRYLDANRDGTTDVIVRFRVRDAEIAFGDREVCLFGETTDGRSIEGCDEISTRPRPRNWRRAERAPRRWRRLEPELPPVCKPEADVAKASTREALLRGRPLRTQKRRGRLAPHCRSGTSSS